MTVFRTNEQLEQLPVLSCGSALAIKNQWRTENQPAIDAWLAEHAVQSKPVINVPKNPVNVQHPFRAASTADVMNAEKTSRYWRGAHRINCLMVEHKITVTMVSNLTGLQHIKIKNILEGRTLRPTLEAGSLIEAAIAHILWERGHA